MRNGFNLNLIAGVWFSFLDVEEAWRGWWLKSSVSTTGTGSYHSLFPGQRRELKNHYFQTKGANATKIMISHSSCPLRLEPLAQKDSLNFS